MIGVFVEGMLPAALANDPQENLLARVHVRVSIVGLMGVFRRIVRIHVIRHGTAVDHEVGRAVGLGGDAQAASYRAGHAGALG